MGIDENWLAFVQMSKARADSHARVAQFWDTADNILSISKIIFATATSTTTMFDASKYLPASLGAITALISAIAGYLAPHDRRVKNMESSNSFRELMLKMIRVETETDYEELWREYNKASLDEPFVPVNFVVQENARFTQSPEFVMLAKQKEAEVKEWVEVNGESKSSEVNPDEVNPDEVFNPNEIKSDAAILVEIPEGDEENSDGEAKEVKPDTALVIANPEAEE